MRGHRRNDRRPRNQLEPQKERLGNLRHRRRAFRSLARIGAGQGARDPQDAEGAMR